MPLVVVDTSVSLPATLSPSGLTRKFWVLLALGALTYEVEHRQLELDELANQADQEGGVAHGLEQARALIEQADDRRAALLEVMPYGAPDDWVAIGSAPVFDEYERKVREIGQQLNPSIREADVPRLRRQLEVVCPIGAPPFDPTRVPTLTEDRKDDPILYTALIADADLLISDDRHLVPDRHEHFWEHDDRAVTAVTFNTLVAERLEGSGFAPGDIDGSWLAIAHGHRA
jgi:predicted nucleic acid-binding protein